MFFLDILPLIRLGLDSPTHSLVDAAIKCLPVILPALDFSTVKNEVFPPIASTFSKTNSLAIKVRSLEAFAALCGGSMDGETGSSDDLSGVIQDNNNNKAQTTKSSILDKYTIQEKLVPSLKAIKTKEPAVMMAALNVFREVGKIADTDFLALEVLPILWAFSLGPLLDVRQFGEFMTLIKSLSAKIEREQTKKLQELSSGGDSTGFGKGTQSSSKLGNDLGQTDIDSTKNDFERLVLGRSSATSNGQEVDPLGSLGSEPSAPKPSAQGISPTFSWSSNAPGPANRLNNNTLDTGHMSSTPMQSSSASFRTVTPDYNMSSFPSLSPAPRQKTPVSQFPALQPPNSIWNAPNSMGSQQNHQASSASSQSLAALATMRTSTTPMAAMQPPQQTANYSAFSIPPPPPAPSSATGSTYTGLSGPNANKSVFGSNIIAQNTAFPSNNTLSQPPQGTQKQGLDKYESLL